MTEQDLSNIVHRVADVFPEGWKGVPPSWEQDHLWPRALGGADHPLNYQPLREARRAIAWPRTRQIEGQRPIPVSVARPDVAGHGALAGG